MQRTKGCTCFKFLVNFIVLKFQNMEQLEGKRFQSKVYVDKDNFIYREDRAKKSGGHYLKCVAESCGGRAFLNGHVSRAHNHIGSADFAV